MLKQHRFLIPGIILIIILLSIGGGWWLSLPRGDELPASIVIEPSAVEESGIAADAVFNLTSGFTVGEDDLRTMLELEPSINYTLSGGGKAWTLSPVMPLQENTVYTFRVKNTAGASVRSFAFQTRTDLLVNSNYPADRESYVEVNTGIEVRFNRPGVDLSKGFEILPAVSGRFETQEYTCRFIPDKPLEYNSIYRITLQNLRSPDGAVLQEPYTFSFETAQKEGEEDWGDLRPDGSEASFLPGDEMRVRLYGGEKEAAGEYTLTLHKFPGINGYATALRERDAFYRDQYGVKETYKINTENLDEVMNVQGKLMQTDRDTYAPLPDGLSEGYYVFTLTGEGAGREQYVQQLIQVVNLSVYTQSVGGSTLFWLGDPVTGGPASAAIQLEPEKGAKRAGETDENGVATITTDDNEWTYATIVREGTPVWFGRIALAQSREETDLSRQYYAALYTDREIYLPGDPIHFWGVVKARRGGDGPQTVRVGLSTGYLKAGVLSGMEASVDAAGTFSGVLQPDALQSGGYTLTVDDGAGGVYKGSYVQVSEYTKPAYRMTLTTDKDFYYYGETVKFHVSAQYYDGTPAAGAKLLAQCYDARLEDFPVTLDASGEAEFTGVLDPTVYRLEEGRVADWRPRYVGWSVQSADQQAVNLSQWASFQALPSKIAAQMTYEGNGALTIETAVLDDSKVTAEFANYNKSDFERLRGVPADIPMSLVVHKVTYHRIQTGSWYDYVNKQTVPVYETRREETVDRTLPVTTVAGKARVTELPVRESDEVTYWYELRFAGGVYGDVSTEAYPVSIYTYPGDEVYTFFPEDETPPLTPGGTLELGIYKDSVPIEEETGMTLYTLVQDAVVERGVYEQSASIEVQERFMPNLWVAGAYFDGRTMHVMRRQNLSSDASGKELAVKVETDKTEYAPGEEMKVTVSLADADGKPVAGKAVLGVVDEAIFSIAPQQVDLLQQLYGDLYFPTIVDGGTGDQLRMAPMNTGGGMEKMEAMAEDTAAGAAPETGGGQTRSEFADTADFVTLDVPDSGSVTVTVKLKDNVTSWRLTAAAVTERLLAGDTTANVAATLPFYLRPIVTDTYLEGDDVAISVLAVGKALTEQPGGAVEYSFTLGDEGRTPKVAHETVPAGAYCNYNWGKLPAGAYPLHISGKYGEYSDAMDLTVTVAETGMLLPKLETMDLASLSQVESARWPVLATVMDEDAKPGFDALAWLSGQNGQRTEIFAAADRALELYTNLRPEADRSAYTRDKRLERIQENGGVTPLPAAAGDTALTAKMLMAAPELLDQGRAAEFLRAMLQNPAATQEDRVMAYVGLAAVKEPVLLDLSRLYEREGAEMAPYLRLYLGAAFARMGDFDKAGEIYDSVRTVRAGDKLHIDDSEPQRATAAALLLAAECGHDDADGLARYLMNAGQGDTPCNLELLAYAKQALKSAGTGKFTYEQNGKTQEVALEDGMASLRLDAATAKNGRFRSQSGRLYAAVETLQPATGEAAGDFATVTKTYEPVGGTLTPGGQVKVTLTVKFREDAPSGVYQIHDFIPSGLRWLGGEDYVIPLDNFIFPYLSQDGQRISGAVYWMELPEDGGVMPIARTAGTYVRMLAESVEMISGAESAAEAPEANASSTAAQRPEPEAQPAGSAAESSEMPLESEDEAFSAASSDAESSANETEQDPEDPDASIPEDLEPDEGGEAEEIPPEEGEEAVEEPVADTKPYRPMPVEQPKDPNTFTVTYYLSAALPGSFVTENAYVTYEGEAVKSDRGLITVNE